MDETSEKLPNFCIGIDLLGPDPTSSKNKTELKKLASCAFRKLVGRPAAANFGRKTFTENRTDTNWASTAFKGKISVFIVVFKFFMPAFVISGQSDWSRKIYLAITTQITQEDINLLLTKWFFSRSRNDRPMFVNEYKFKEGWQSSSLKTCFLDFAEQNVNVFTANPNHTPRLLTNMLVF